MPESDERAPDPTVRPLNAVIGGVVGVLGIVYLISHVVGWFTTEDVVPIYSEKIEWNAPIGTCVPTLEMWENSWRLRMTPVTNRTTRKCWATYR